MAKIKPLHGKYYGTEIELDTGQTITIWCPDYNDFKPSIRELNSGWTEDMGMDHQEDVHSYELAKIVCQALTDKGY